MPIKLVVNGYFRSGTTFIWKYLNNELKKYNYLCFYEPLNPGLANLINIEKEGNRINKLHGGYLFQDYLNLDENILNKILLNNPFANENQEPRNTFEIKNYLDIYNSMDRDVFLQTNRLHFFLDMIFERYSSKVIHIIRDPLDVWLSIKKAFEVREYSSFIRSLIIFLTKPFRLKNAFNIYNDFKWIFYKTGYPVNYDKFFIKRFFGFNAFELFIIVWTIFNYYAVKSINDNGGLVLAYEKIIENQFYLKDKVERYLSYKLDNAPNVMKGNFNKYSNVLSKKMNRVLKKFEIEDKYNTIMKLI